MTDPCTQQEKISNLQSNQNVFMEILKEVKNDVKDIKKYLFEWWLEDNYAKKTSVNRLRTIVWSIIWFFFLAFGAVVIAMVKYFLSLNI